MSRDTLIAVGVFLVVWGIPTLLAWAFTRAATRKPRIPVPPPQEKELQNLKRPSDEMRGLRITINGPVRRI